MPTLLERARREGTPLIDGSSATFVWQGAPNEFGGGDVPQLIGDFTGWRENPVVLTESEPGVWTHTITLPVDAYVEYAFSIKYDVAESFPDPFNPRIVFNGIDSVNHYFTMPDHQPNDLLRRKAGVQRGAISEHWLETGIFTGDSHRKVYLYHPPVEEPTREPTPLVVVWDGGDYLSRGRLNVIVDNLIAEKRIRPIALALIDNGDGARFVEYMQNEATVGMLGYRLLPLAREHLNLIDAGQQPGIHGVLGSSMGGLMALYTGLRSPEVFGHVVCQSGAFWFNQPRDMMIVDYVKHSAAVPLKIWQDVGTLEYLLDGNRKMNALLSEKGYDVTYREFSGGHNQTMWADNSWRGLEALYAPHKPA
ncbi:MAG: alpha/beta hydrolase-fold protein [Chloroflexota bacterium]